MARCSAKHVSTTGLTGMLLLRQRPKHQRQPWEVYMSDEDLEVLVTLDDPWYGPEEDIFHHLQPVTYWPGLEEDRDNEMLLTFI
jgi:hypothetical protein